MIKFSLLIALVYLSYAADKEVLFKSDLDNTQDHVSQKPFKDSKDSILSTLLIDATPAQPSEEPVHLDVTSSGNKGATKKKAREAQLDVKLELASGSKRSSRGRKQTNEAEQTNRRAKFSI